MTRKRIILLTAALFLAVALLLAVLLTVSIVPKLRAQAFVALYHDEIETMLAEDGSVPADDAVLFGYEYVNSWDGEHPVTEFLLGTRGFLMVDGRYFGCHYSPDDVPATFQNAGEELISDGQDRWVWQGEGDNHGFVERLQENWYYFEAKF